MALEQHFNFQHSHQVRVRYGETDQMGYCYYGNYAQFFEIGRVEALRAIGMSYKSMEDEGIMLPVGDLSVKYIAPSFYDDLLTVTTFVKSMKGARIFFSYEIKNEDGKLITVGETTLVFVSKESMRPCVPPKNFMNAINNYLISAE